MFEQPRSTLHSITSGGAAGAAGRAQVVSAVALALAMLAGGNSPVEAAGLGRLTVQSALGQPLRAEVEVTSVRPDEAASLTAKLASPDAFSKAGLQYKEAHGAVRMAVEERNGRYVIKLTSTRPINEPFVDLMVELSWAAGKFVREYTFLLDPPVQRDARQQAPRSNAPVVGAATSAALGQGGGAVRTIDPVTGRLISPDGSTSAAGSRSRVGNSRTATTSAAQAPAASSGGGTVVVGRGETLGIIAGRVRPASATLEQTIVAIYRNNPNAFIQNNPNLIREGQTLELPAEPEIMSIDSAEAGRQLRIAARDFRSYKERLAAVPVEVGSGTGSTTASGTVSAKVDDQGSKTASVDRLELSRSGSEGDKNASAIGARDAEAVVARDAALKEANSRIAELERNVGDLQRMLELKNKSLADLQKQLEQARAAGASVSGQVAAGTAAAVAQQQAAAEQKAAAEKAAAEKVAMEKAAAEKAAAEKLAAEKAAAEKAVAEQQAAAEKAAAEQAAAAKAVADRLAAEQAASEKAEAERIAAEKLAAEKAAAEAKAVVEKTASGDMMADQAEGGAEAEAGPSPEKAAERQPDAAADTIRQAAGDAADGDQQPGMFEGLTQSPMLLPALGVFAVIAGLGYVVLRRRRRDEDGFGDSISADEFTANSLFGTTGGQSVDTMTGGTTQITTISESTPTEVDPIAEAEVYIAYGRETQAEEILREALKRQPERQAIRLKLLEIFSGRKDTVAFSQMAREMHEMTGGLNEEWPRVASMGAALDPDNALYGDGQRATQASSPADGMNLGAAAAAAAGAAAMGVASQAEPADVAPEPVGMAPSVSDEPVTMPEEDAGLDFDPGIEQSLAALESDGQPAAGTESALPATGEMRSGPLAAMPSVDLPSLDLDSPLDLDEGPSTVTDLNVDTTITDSLSVQGDVHESGVDDVDLSSIGLDLSPSTISGPITMSGAASSQWQEMASKLDLASAYTEIGDKEGARELLEEVLNGGDAVQQQRARELLADL